MDPNTRIGNTTIAKVRQASVLRIMKEVVSDDPELIRETIIAGLTAPAPRSFPYLALVTAMLDGKPPAEPREPSPLDLSNLTHEQLVEKAQHVMKLLTDGAGTVIEAEVVPDNPTVDEIRQAEEELRRANEELARANAEVERLKRP